MKTAGIYPSLGRYFRTQTELADAACMSRTVPEEIDSSDLNDIVEARQDFDKIFKTKE